MIILEDLNNAFYLLVDTLLLRYALVMVVMNMAAVHLFTLKIFTE